MLMILWLVGDLDESRQVDSILKALGVVKYEYAGWQIANFDTLPLSDSIPVPKGKYKVIDGYKPLHVRGKWEYYKRDWKTTLLMPEMGTDRYEDTTTLLDWGKYLVIFIRGKGRYEVGFTYIYHNKCMAWTVAPFELKPQWQEIRIKLDTGVSMYSMEELIEFLKNLSPLSEEPAIWCYRRSSGIFIPLSLSIIPLVDTFGTYEFEIELSPIYLVK